MTAWHYRDFRVAIYARVFEVNEMGTPGPLERVLDSLGQHLGMDAFYLETYRDRVRADEAAVMGARKCLESRGLKAAGGIALTIDERNRFQTFCYTNPEHRRLVAEVSAYTARLFDEFILDDFFFTKCKCPSCIAAKGDRSWTRFRLTLMTEAARELVLAPARAANPRVKVTIKYPNWYEHYQGLGYDLAEQPRLFDAVYTGTETRDPVLDSQHLQPYHGYALVRYLENVRPGGNAGGWVDPDGSHVLDRYAEQLWLTLFAKAPEVTLFDYGSIQRSIKPSQRGAWQRTGTSFDFDAATRAHRRDDGTLGPGAWHSLAAGAGFAAVDGLIGRLGNPIGVPAYKPLHSSGEDFLHGYLGMCGIPVEMVPRFPSEAPTVLLTASSASDGQIVARMSRHLEEGGTIVATSGLLRALEGRGIEDIVEARIGERRLVTKDYLVGWDMACRGAQAVTVPCIEFRSNDAWEEVSCIAGMAGSPLLASTEYGRGTLYVVAVPDNFSDLYLLPDEVLSRVREIATRALPVRIEGPAQVALFVYDNGTFIVESFLPQPCRVRLVVRGRIDGIEDMATGSLLGRDEDGADAATFAVTIPPHSFRAFRAK